MNTTVDKDYVETFDADAVIIAVGSEPIVPPLKGLDGEQVIIVNDYYLKKDQVDDSIVVLGGGLAGCEAAIHLAMEGKSVQLIEMRAELAPDANIRHRPILLEEIKKQNIVVKTEYKGVEVTKEGVICEDTQGNKTLVEGKTVICALGQKPRRDVVDTLIDAAPYVATIGDCVKASTITTAVYQGHHAALDI